MSPTEPPEQHPDSCEPDECGCYPLEESSLLSRTLERLIGIVAAFCLMALMVGGTVALLRWWL